MQRRPRFLVRSTKFTASKVFDCILWAWVLTIPASALVAYLLVRLARAMDWLG